MVVEVITLGKGHALVNYGDAHDFSVKLIPCMCSTVAALAEEMIPICWHNFVIPSYVNLATYALSSTLITLSDKLPSFVLWLVNQQCAGSLCSPHNDDWLVFYHLNSGNVRPSHWDPMPLDPRSSKEAALHCADLPVGSKEYNEVLQEFDKTMKPGGVAHYTQIVKIQRIQNPMLYAQYIAKKKDMEKHNPPGHQNEKRLFHGTPADVCPKINQQGFNRSFAGKNGETLSVYWMSSCLHLLLASMFYSNSNWSWSLLCTWCFVLFLINLLTAWCKRRKVHLPCTSTCWRVCSG